MIAGLLALMLVSVDTTSRFALGADSVGPVVVAVVDTLPVVSLHAPLSLEPIVIESVTMQPRLLLPLADTVRKKRKLVEYSDWYGRRLTIHKTLSWAMIPLFGVSYWTGERLARDGRINSPYYVRALHPYAATGASVVFGVNTVTGLWNLWDARHDPNGRTRRIIHSALFLIADGGFAYAGSIGKKGRENSEIRNRHRTIALSSMGVSTAGWLIMLIGNR